MRSDAVTPTPRTCQFCPIPALFDAKTVMGPWAYLCSTHMEAFGIRLGMGLGQRLPASVIETDITD
jgi:hypothetical protein